MNPQNINISKDILAAGNKHFEDTWNRAEEVTKNFIPDPPISSHIEQIRKYLNLVETNNLLLGEIIFEICAMTRKMNINIDALLNRVCDHYEKELIFHKLSEAFDTGGCLKKINP